MDEKDIENLKDLQFAITKEFKEIVLEIATTRQILDECELPKKDRKLLEKHFEKLKKRLATILQEENPIQTQIIRSYLSSKKEIDQK